MGSMELLLFHVFFSTPFWYIGKYDADFSVSLIWTIQQLNKHEQKKGIHYPALSVRNCSGSCTSY